MPGKVKASYYVSETVARGVRLLAASEGRSQSEIAQEAIERFLRDHEASMDLLRAAEGAFRFWENPEDAEYDAL